MSKKLLIKLLGFGLLTWAIPYFGAFPFFSPEKGLLIDNLLFHNIMMILGTLVATILLINIFKNINKNFIQAGLIIGFVWLVMNWVLDVLFLLPMSKMSFSQYFIQIGVGYLVGLIYALGIAFIAKYKSVK